MKRNDDIRRISGVACVKPRTYDQQMLANSVGRQKSVVVFKKLANILCSPTMLAIYKLVCSLLANKRQIVRHDWLAVVNIMAAEWTDASCVDYTNYTSTFHLCIIHECIQTDFGHLRFRLCHLCLRQCRRLLSPPSQP